MQGIGYGALCKPGGGATSHGGCGPRRRKNADHSLTSNPGFRFAHPGDLLQGTGSENRLTKDQITSADSMS